MSTREKATSTVPVGTVEQSTQAEAQRRLGKIRSSLAHSDGLLVEAWRARDWKALGHKTWKAYVEEQLPELYAISIRAEVRDPRIVELAREGMSQGAIADMLGIGRGTVNRALADVDLGDTVIASDGRTMAARAPRSPVKRRGPRKTDRVVLLLEAAPDGLDIRGITKGLRCDRHEASATCTRLVEAKRIAYRAPERRGQFGRYYTASTVPTGTV